MEAMIERVWRCTWRRELYKLGDVLGNSDCVRSDKYWELDNGLSAVW